MKTITLILLVGLGVAAAGCGSGGKSPQVANLGTTSTPTRTTQGSGPLTAGGAGPGGKGLHVAMRGNLKYSRCMRANGVHNFPDPNGNGVVGIDSSSGVNPSSPVFQAAQKKCAADLPNGGKATPQQLAKMKQNALAFSACMRAHGIKDFPDPDFSGGGVKVSLGSRHAGSDLNLNNPTFQKAQQACQSNLGKP
jgi:hypothetical protein